MGHLILVRVASPGIAQGDATARRQRKRELVLGAINSMPSPIIAGLHVRREGGLGSGILGEAILRGLSEVIDGRIDALRLDSGTTLGQVALRHSETAFVPSRAGRGAADATDVTPCQAGIGRGSGSWAGRKHHLPRTTGASRHQVTGQRHVRCRPSCGTRACAPAIRPSQPRPRRSKTLEDRRASARRSLRRGPCVVGGRAV